MNASPKGYIHVVISPSCREGRVDHHMMACACLQATAVGAGAAARCCAAGFTALAEIQFADTIYPSLHVPGIQIFIPSGRHDAKGLLISLIEEQYPVVCFESQIMYQSREDLVRAETIFKYRYVYFPETNPEIKNYEDEETFEVWIHALTLSEKST